MESQVFNITSVMCNTNSKIIYYLLLECCFYQDNLIISNTTFIIHNGTVIAHSAPSKRSPFLKFIIDNAVFNTTNKICNTNSTIFVYYLLFIYSPKIYLKRWFYCLILTPEFSLLETCKLAIEVSWV